MGHLKGMLWKECFTLSDYSKFKTPTKERIILLEFQNSRGFGNEIPLGDQIKKLLPTSCQYFSVSKSKSSFTQQQMFVWINEWKRRPQNTLQV